MKLDSRILEGKKPLTCFDVEQAKEFLGKECYFSDQLCTFNKLLDAYSYVTADILVSKEKYLYVGELLTVSDSDGSCYEAGINGEAEWFQFCLPCEWVREEKKEPKYRPFKDHAEYKEYLNDGIIESWIQIREKLTGEVSELMYVGGSGAIICLGAYSFDLNELFYDFELFNENTGEWQPFGVMEDD